MKKTIAALTACFLMAFSLSALAQNDSSRTNFKIVSDSSYRANDTITIGNMIIVKKQGEQDNHIENNSWYNKKRNITHGTRINITNGKIAKDTFFSANGDSVQIGSLLIVTNKEATKPDFKTIIKVGDASYGRPIEGGEYGWIKGDFKKTKIEIAKEPKKLKNVTTNWFAFDLGYTNYRNESPNLVYIMQQYPSMPLNYVTPYNLKLKNSKSSNFNIWIVQQKVNLYQHKLNAKYGIGFEMFNFRLEQPVGFRDDVSSKMVLENISFSKNKLFAKYLTVPFQFSYQANPENKRSFYISAGMSAGYLIDARNKQISTERGKQKYNGNFNLNNWRVATIGELGVGGVRLYGSYGLTNLFDKQATYFEMYPFSMGLRFSKF